MLRLSAVTFAVVTASLLALTVHSCYVAPASLPVVFPFPDFSYKIPEKSIKPDDRAARIDAFMKRLKAPLEGYGRVFVSFADTYGLDWRLIAAMSVRESTGGREACGFNSLGWDSCHGYNFESWEEGIRYVSSRLSGSPIYRGKTIREKLQIYNPPTIVPRYAQEVETIMEMISQTVVQ